MNYENKEMIKSAMQGMSLTVYGNEFSEGSIEQFFVELDLAKIENPNKVIDAIRSVKNFRMKTENYKKIVVGEILNSMKQKEAWSKKDTLDQIVLTPDDSKAAFIFFDIYEAIKKNIPYNRYCRENGLHDWCEPLLQAS
jgi:hypothetical protein